MIERDTTYRTAAVRDSMSDDVKSVLMMMTTFKYSAVPVLCRVILISLFLPEAVQSTWWYLGLSSSVYDRTLTSPNVHYASKCYELASDVLAVRQMSLCAQSNNLLHVVSSGASLALDECQHQLRHSRWNCSTVNDTSVFGSVLSAKSRERAFVFAMTSAGIMYAVVNACAKGLMPTCSCDVTDHVTHRHGDNEVDFLWGGCSHDVTFGDKFTREFVDEIEDALTANGALNVWNNGAGRQSVVETTKLLCKCHGVSGSCSSKICWRAVTSFRQVGDQLKDKYDGASRVKFRPAAASPRRSNSESALTRTKPLLRVVDRRQKKPTASDLVYFDDSPDYCEPNEATGALGTHGRMCNRTSPATDGCQLMCCGRGYRTLVEVSVEECDCTFVWCCRVDCQKCRRTVHTYQCN